ncbi:hypothetical protein [Microbulbifer variabilis]|uniref:hypothetical protein n=1 Tax=Microbulbifer variabilis TaxID=266805 RepID=UPI001CFE3F2A|nr:hypothetical protein [Microbulbifer variabilis]
MKMKLIVLLIAVVSVNAFGGEKLDILWNDGPKNRCFRHVQQNHDVADMETEYLQNDDCPIISRRQTSSSCDSFGNNGYCPLWNVITYGWDISDKDRSPGWSLWNISGGWGSPLEIALINNTQGLPDPCKLREVSFSWEWPDLSLKRTSEGKPIILGDITSLEVEFKAKVANKSKPLCTYPSTLYVSQDVVVRFPNDISYSIGVLVFNFGNIDMNSIHCKDKNSTDEECEAKKNDEIFFTNYNELDPNKCFQEKKCQTILHGDKLSSNARYLDVLYQENKFEFLSLFKNEKYLPKPPAPYTWNDATITHIQLVNHSRGGNLRVDVKDQHVNSLPSNSIKSIKCDGIRCFFSSAD